MNERKVDVCECVRVGNLLQNYSKMESRRMGVEQVCFTLPNCFYFIPHHHMMYVRKSPLAGWGKEGVEEECMSYASHIFRVNNLKLNLLQLAFV